MLAGVFWAAGILATPALLPQRLDLVSFNVMLGIKHWGLAP